MLPYKLTINKEKADNVHAGKHSPRSRIRKEKPPTIVGGYMYILHNIHNRTSIVWTSRNIPLDYFREEKTSCFRRRYMFALPIFPSSHPPSIVGAHELNFCVRDGNRWTLMAINTNLFTCLVTRTGFEPMLTA